VTFLPRSNQTVSPLKAVLKPMEGASPPRLAFRRFRPVPVEIRPDVGTTFAAGGAGEPILNIRRPHIIRPAIAADRHRMAAAIGAISQETARRRAQFGVLFFGFESVDLTVHESAARLSPENATAMTL
jgi:hypothetical protein